MYIHVRNMLNRDKFQIYVDFIRFREMDEDELTSLTEMEKDSTTKKTLATILSAVSDIQYLIHHNIDQLFFVLHKTQANCFKIVDAAIRCKTMECDGFLLCTNRCDVTHKENVQTLLVVFDRTKKFNVERGPAYECICRLYTYSHMWERILANNSSVDVLYTEFCDAETTVQSILKNIITIE